MTLAGQRAGVGGPLPILLTFYVWCLFEPNWFRQMCG